jgi:hypothetical protein
VAGRCTGTSAGKVERLALAAGQREPGRGPTGSRPLPLSGDEIHPARGLPARGGSAPYVGFLNAVEKVPAYAESRPEPEVEEALEGQIRERR